MLWGQTWGCFQKVKRLLASSRFHRSACFLVSTDILLLLGYAVWHPVKAFVLTHTAGTGSLPSLNSNGPAEDSFLYHSPESSQFIFI